MFAIDLKNEFKRLAIQKESLENQLLHTFVIKEKDIMKTKIKFINEKIDVILDEYNRGEGRIHNENL